MTSESNTAPSSISVDWKKLWGFILRFVTGLGLALFWASLAIITLTALVWVGIFVAKLPFAGMLGMAIAVPIIICVWWISYYMTLDFLDEVGIGLEGPWRWLIIPIALPFAPLSFFFGYVAGLGELAKTRNASLAFLGIGVLLILGLALLLLR
ncbi:hypothetical protein ACXR0O_04425 [Verrucomicrobiota bacterium sgz303538]